MNHDHEEMGDQIQTPTARKVFFPKLLKRCINTRQIRSLILKCQMRSGVDQQDRFSISYSNSLIHHVRLRPLPICFLFG